MSKWEIIYKNKKHFVEGKTPGNAAYKFFKWAINNNVMKNRPKPDDCGGWEGISINVSTS